MKIGCPNCGQHYEIEAGAIDHYFRCTECNTLFRGINAKPVKVKRFRRKSKSREPEAAIAAALHTIEPEDDALHPVAAEASDEAASGADHADAPDETASESAPPAEESADESAEWPMEEAVPVLQPHNRLIRERIGVLLGVLAVLVALILIGAILRLNGRLKEVQLRNAAYAAESARQNNALLDLQDQNDALVDTLQKLQDQFAVLARQQSQTVARIGASDTDNRLKQLDERLKALDPKSTSGESLNSRLDNCQNKLALLEKNFQETTNSQKTATLQFNNELMRLLGAPHKNTKRTILERIDLLESLNMNNLTAAGIPEKLPRYPMVTRLEIVETLLSGNDDISLAQRYPGGIMAQLEALKTEVAKVKWALGK